jgi:hypothetical protein
MRAIFLTAAIGFLTTGLAWGQAASTTAKPPAKTAATKTTATKTAATQTKKAPVKKKAVTPERQQLKTAAISVAAGVEAAEAAMTPAELAIAERVQTGNLPCELGNSVSLEADPKAPGYFNLKMKNVSYRMFPVATTTGAIRLEDQKAGAVWLQLANKSMLMNHKLGQRLADECLSPEQTVVAEALRKNPPPSVLDAPAPAVAQKAAP